MSKKQEMLRSELMSEAQLYRIQGKISFIMSKIFRQSVKLINLKRFVIFCFQKQINARYQIQSSYRSTNHAF